MDILIGIIDSIVRILGLIWWLILPFFVFFLYWNLRMIYIRTRHIKTIQWSMFEIKIPKDILKTPKAMEQIFSGLIATYSFGLSSVDKYIDGKVEPWISFEMMGHAGGVHFFVRIPSKFRNLLESAIYAQYPAAELHEAEDYTEHLSPNLPNEAYDIWGTDLILSRENYYPIRTYPFFEETQEEKRLDPIAAISEVMSNLNEDETIWLQILISPTGEPSGNYWQKEGLEKIDEIAGRKTKKSGAGWGSSLWDWARNIFWAPMEQPTWPEGKTEEIVLLRFLHPGEQEIVKAISNKISKFGFETNIRFVYIDKRDNFTPVNVSAVIGAFQQFSTSDLNSFKPDRRTITLKNGWLPKFFPKYKRLVEFSRKRRIFDGYVSRRFGKYNKRRPEKFPILNIEELATIYHFPTMMVEAPRLRKLEAKKAGPPAELPIE
ncbi:hypothetical protein GW816_00370 [Candidatus Wolfebacteria bacterium]|nr:hypothetical protein [Parcubacteria group bacterium]NCO89486.1 hypothetical protein [Candidatus Wolfebacteria bacterium]NCP58538.1 hypothetical protein [Candidatus Wolfebacteria bacterium]NCQ02502.1 hypothetical protein [Candidatus Wolfebacteria bacterium]PIY59000.1 MAG: hypothetical protein COY97_01200 [Candidatus Wolfebacteria bacterium CG_4_10_14_0_8_um_filter_39_64]